MCGSPGLTKMDGLFVCQSCGTRYTLEEARKLITVKLDTTDEVKNLFQLARRALKDEDNENAARYYDMILLKDPNSWEAAFYVVYCKARECTINQIEDATNAITNCLDTVLELIKTHVPPQEQESACKEVHEKVMSITSLLEKAAQRTYEQLDSQQKLQHRNTWLNRLYAIIQCLYTLGDEMDKFFDSEDYAHPLSAQAWQRAVAWHQSIICFYSHKSSERNKVHNYQHKIQCYFPEYQLPPESLRGCYIATAVYGSYDCPPVWVLRRYRDDVLASRWYGRLMIRTYYAISPSLVRCFGNTHWFQRLWKGPLDHLVRHLQGKGFASTPYKDR